MRTVRWLIVVVIMAFASISYSQPVLQVGAPGGPGEGTYADYIDLLSNPTETDTAITSGNIIYVAGAYNSNVINLGAQYGCGDNWSAFEWNTGGSKILYPTAFNSYGAVLIVSVPDGSLSSALSSLTIGGSSAFYSDEQYSYFPNNHDPVKDNISDFLFFNIGDFAPDAGLIPDFADETAGNKWGEIKELDLAGTDGLDWIHFDVIALQTKRNCKTKIKFNPPSHDLTWKENGNGHEVPEPGTILLLGLGLLGVGAVRRRFKI